MQENPRGWVRWMSLLHMELPCNICGIYICNLQSFNLILTGMLFIALQEYLQYYVIHICKLYFIQKSAENTKSYGRHLTRPHFFGIHRVLLGGVNLMLHITSRVVSRFGKKIRKIIFVETNSSVNDILSL